MELGDVTRLLRATPTMVAALFDGLDDEVARRRPAPDQWSPVEVLGHLVTCDDLAFHDRVLRIVATDGAVLPRFDADAAAAARDDRSRDVGDVVDEFVANRARFVTELEALDPAALTGAAGGPDAFAGITAWDFVVEWPHHDLDHLAQVTEAVNDHLLTAMTPAMQAALRPGSPP